MSSATWRSSSARVPRRSARFSAARSWASAGTAALARHLPGGLGVRLVYHQLVALPLRAFEARVNGSYLGRSAAAYAGVAIEVAAEARARATALFKRVLG